MRGKGWSALAVLMAVGCASVDPARVPGPLAGTAPRSGACGGNRPVACEARAEPTCSPSRPAPALALADRPATGEGMPPDPGLATSSAPVLKEEAAPPPEVEVEEPPATEPVALGPPAAAPSETAPATGPVEPESVAPPAPAESRVIPDKPRGTSPAARQPAPSRPKGRPVASVGDELITLPELTEAVKARLAEVGTGGAPTRRQMMTLSRSVLKAMVVRSLVLQEATEKLGGPGGLDEARARIERTWLERDLPAILRRQGVASEADLRAKLAPSLASPESLREEAVVRSLATEMMRADGPSDDLEAYLDGLRRRRPIAALMSPAELAVAGRQAALAEGAR